MLAFEKPPKFTGRYGSNINNRKPTRGRIIQHRPMLIRDDKGELITNFNDLPYDLRNRYARKLHASWVGNYGHGFYHPTRTEVHKVIKKTTV